VWKWTKYIKRGSCNHCPREKHMKQEMHYKNWAKNWGGACVGVSSKDAFGWAKVDCDKEFCFVSEDP